jgi:hypothetical protein
MDPHPTGGNREGTPSVGGEKRRPEITSEEFRLRLANMGCTQRRFAEQAGYSERAIRQCLSRARVSVGVAVALRHQELLHGLSVILGTAKFRHVNEGALATLFHQYVPRPPRAPKPAKVVKKRIRLNRTPRKKRPPRADRELAQKTLMQTELAQRPVPPATVTIAPQFHHQDVILGGAARTHFFSGRMTKRSEDD